MPLLSPGPPGVDVVRLVDVGSIPNESADVDVVAGLVTVAGVIPEPVGVEPVGVEPVGVEPVGVEPVDVEPVGVEPVGVEPVGVEPVGFVGTVEVGSEPLGVAAFARFIENA
ncbi:hypothetical protein [uncultured Jatrophihabitans sp.]|uniref:hypothetical protein n=1 Tax=uncultured Jatrophihabitans sp. TaxID=1610747 RepID=UPI0035CBE6FA